MVISLWTIICFVKFGHVISRFKMAAKKDLNLKARLLVGTCTLQKKNCPKYFCSLKTCILITVFC